MIICSATNVRGCASNDNACEVSAKRLFARNSYDMFEQELQNAAPVERSQEGDLFHNYELKHWEYGPRSYKVLAASTLITFFTLLFIAQTDLLTRRGCESPWVGSVCQVLDMAYVGSMLYGTESEYVDAEYAAIDLEDGEVTFIDVSGETPPLSYPEGYFQIANPEEYAAMVAAQQNPTSTSTYNPTTTYPTTTNDLASTPQQLPPSNPNAVSGSVPDSPFSVSDTPNYRAMRKGKGRNRLNPNSNTNTNSDQTVAQNDSNTNTAVDPPLNSEQVLAVEINKRPMVDLANSINALKEKGPLNLESEFVVTGKGKLDKTGKLDPKSFTFGPASGKDEAVINVVKESVEAINDANYLAYIKDIIGKELSFVLAQNAENLEATFQTDLDNDSLARQRKTSLDLAISFAKQRKQSQNASQDDKDDLTLLEGVKTEVVGKTLKIKFVVPKGIAHPMIQRKLAEQAAEVRKPSGQVTGRQNDDTAPK